MRTGEKKSGSASEAAHASETGTWARRSAPNIDALARVEVVRGDAQRAGHVAEVVGDAAAEEDLGEEALVAIEREEARGERVVEAVDLLPEEEVRGRAGGAVSARGEAGERVADGDAPVVSARRHSSRSTRRRWLRSSGKKLSTGSRSAR